MLLAAHLFFTIPHIEQIITICASVKEVDFSDALNRGQREKLGFILSFFGFLRFGAGRSGL